MKSAVTLVVLWSAGIILGMAAATLMMRRSVSDVDQELERMWRFNHE
jgi:hypothetical protein